MFERRDRARGTWATLRAASDEGRRVVNRSSETLVKAAMDQSALGGAENHDKGTRMGLPTPTCMVHGSRGSGVGLKGRNGGIRVFEEMEWEMWEVRFGISARSDLERGERGQEQALESMKQGDEVLEDVMSVM